MGTMNIKTHIGQAMGRTAWGLFLSLMLWAPIPASAAVTDIAIEPLPTLVSTKTKPNILFILDNSGSMGWDYMPDDVNNAASSYTTTYGYKSAQCNGVAYDPTYTYVPPVKADGTNYPNAVFTAAMANGYTPKPPTYGSTYSSSSTETTALGSKTFRFTDGFTFLGFGGSGLPNWANGTTISIEDPADPNHWMVGTVTNTGSNQCSGFGLFGICLFGNSYRDVVINVTQVNGSGASSPWGLTAFSLDNLTGSTYYNYTGTQTKMGWTYTAAGVSNTTFKNECISHPGSPSGEAGDGKFTGVVLTAASTEAQNYANWYQYYRTRMLMTRSGAGRAFQPLTNRYRVGFTTINDTDIAESSAWTDIQSGQAFLHVKDFDSTQRSAFLDRLYNTDASGGTPLRSALSKAGRYFAAQLGGQTAGTYKDPVQYACQRNYAFLSTDGYWNDSSNPKQLNGSTDIGQQDAADVRPFSDGGAATKVTVTTSTERRETTTPATVTQGYTRNTYSYGALNAGGCLFSYKETRTAQSTSTSGSGNQVVTTDWTTTTTTTDTYNAGTASTSTVVTGPSSTVISTVNPSAPALTGAETWVNGAVTTSCTGSKLTSPGAASLFGSATVTPTGSGTTIVLSTTTSGPTTTVAGGAGGTANTLADVAEYYYTNDLRTSALGNCTAGAGGSGDVCDNTGLTAAGRDTALWQHMSTFTLGLGVNGSLTYDRYYLDHATVTTSTYYKLIQGTVAWPAPVSNSVTTIDDLWHTAVNGRGQYFGANNATDLTNGLRSALTNMGRVPGAGSAVGLSSITPSGTNNLAFGSTYATVDWTGDLMAYRIQADGSLSEPLSGTGQGGVDSKAWRGANTSDTRTIYYRKPSTTTLMAFTYTNLSADSLGTNFTNFCTKSVSDTSTVYPQQCATLTAGQKTLANDGTNLVNWLRGYAAYEETTNLTNPIYRGRVSALGDIVNSGPAYVGAPELTYTDTGYSDFKTAQAARKPMVYVGSNDGMLHAFSGDAADVGAEMWAFVPTAVMPNMFRLANTDYSNNHQYLVDGTPVVGDIYVGGAWKTILVAGLNSGGKSVYALDITNPSSPSVLWEFTDTDLGYVYGRPVITKRANGTWVVAFGSGYNNTGNGYLYVLNANTGVQAVTKIPTNVGGAAVGTLASPSGLSRINAWIDSVSNNTAKRFYGGDLKGNVWRFDIDNLVAPNGQAQRLAVLQINATTPQPITMRTALAEITYSGTSYPVVLVGTGRYLGATDLTDTTQQSLYAIKDPLTATDWGDVRANVLMIPQTLSTSGTSRTASTSAVNWASAIGWRMDLPTSKERVTADMVVQYNTVGVGTGIPGVGGTCSPAGGTGWIYGIDISTGGGVDGAAAGAYNDSGLVTGVAWVQKADKTSELVGTDTGGGTPNTTGIGGGGGSSGPPVMRRASWRELFNN
jgi:type IV pilus assembly protein PilY1